MIDSKQLKDYIIIPVLKGLNMYSETAVELMLGTAAVESDMGRYIHQINGPALGIYQMEPKTHDDIWKNWLKYRPELRTHISEEFEGRCTSSNLIGDLLYATTMTRVHYRRAPAYLPKPNNIEELARYWRKFYNTSKGAHSTSEAIEKFISKYKEYVRPYVID